MSENAVELTQAMMLVLIALRKCPQHGYALMLEISRMTEGQYAVAPGTLYRSISQLLMHKLIEEQAPAFDPRRNKDLRRRYYKITDPGCEALELELKRLEKLLLSARS